MRRRMQMRRAIDVRGPTPRIVGNDRKLALKWSNRARIRSIDLVHGGPQWTTPATCVSFSSSIITPFVKLITHESFYSGTLFSLCQTPLWVCLWLQSSPLYNNACLISTGGGGEGGSDALWQMPLKFPFCILNTSLSKDIKWCIWKKRGSSALDMCKIFFWITKPNSRIMARIFFSQIFFWLNSVLYSPRMKIMSWFLGLLIWGQRVCQSDWTPVAPKGANEDEFLVFIIHHSNYLQQMFHNQQRQKELYATCHTISSTSFGVSVFASLMKHLLLQKVIYLFVSMTCS